MPKKQTLRDLCEYFFTQGAYYGRNLVTRGICTAMYLDHNELEFMPMSPMQIEKQVQHEYGLVDWSKYSVDGEDQKWYDDLNIPDRLRGYATPQEMVDGANKDIEHLRVQLEAEKHRTKRLENELAEMRESRSIIKETGRKIESAHNNHLDAIANRISQLFDDIPGLGPRVAEKTAQSSDLPNLGKTTRHMALLRMLDEWQKEPETEDDKRRWEELEQYLKNRNESRTKLFDDEAVENDIGAQMAVCHKNMSDLMTWAYKNQDKLMQPPDKWTPNALVTCILRTIRWQNERLTTEGRMNPNTDAADQLSRLKQAILECDPREIDLVRPKDIVDYAIDAIETVRMDH